MDGERGGGGGGGSGAQGLGAHGGVLITFLVHGLHLVKPVQEGGGGLFTFRAHALHLVKPIREGGLFGRSSSSSSSTGGLLGLLYDDTHSGGQCDIGGGRRTARGERRC